MTIFDPSYDNFALILLFLAGAAFGWGFRGLRQSKESEHVRMLQQELARMTQMRGNEAKEAHIAEAKLPKEDHPWNS